MIAAILIAAAVLFVVLIVAPLAGVVIYGGVKASREVRR